MTNFQRVHSRLDCEGTNQDLVIETIKNVAMTPMQIVDRTGLTLSAVHVLLNTMNCSAPARVMRSRLYPGHWISAEAAPDA